MFQLVDKINIQYTGLQKLILLLLFPLFDVTDIAHFKERALYKLLHHEVPGGFEPPYAVLQTAA